MDSSARTKGFSPLDMALGFGLLLLLANWSDSTRNTTWYSCRWGPPHAHRGFGITTAEGVISVWAGRARQGIFGIHWTGVRFDRLENSADRRGFGPLYPASIDLQIADRPTVGVAYWALLLGYAASWAWLLRWRHCRATRTIQCTEEGHHAVRKIPGPDSSPLDHPLRRSESEIEPW